MQSPSLCCPILRRSAPETLEQFIMAQMDRAGLGHNTFTAEALALIIRSGDGLLRRTRNLCLSSLLEAIRDQLAPSISSRATASSSNLTGAKTMTTPSHSPAPRWTREPIRTLKTHEDTTALRPQVENPDTTSNRPDVSIRIFPRG